MFWISTAVFISATILFWFFGSAEIQSWNNLNQQKISTFSEEEITQMTAVAIKELQSEEEDDEYKAANVN